MAGHSKGGQGLKRTVVQQKKKKKKKEEEGNERETGKRWKYKVIKKLKRGRGITIGRTNKRNLKAM
jgi:hypothetical protein